MSMIESAGDNCSSNGSNNHTDGSSTPSSKRSSKPPFVHKNSVHSDYCFNDVRARETENAQRLLGLPLNNEQFLVAKGILTKICRRKPKQRTFYLFNDSLVYANVSYGKLLAHPQSYRLEDVVVSDVVDSGIFRNGFIVETSRKSFTVYATISEEKRRWVTGIKEYAEICKKAAGTEPKSLPLILQKSPIWIPNSEATHCMVCLNTEFTLVQRRHHCRNCGKVVCGKCSQYRWVLPSQGPNQLRICKACHEVLRAEQESQKNRLQEQKTVDETEITSTLKPPNRLPAYAPPSWFPSGGDDDLDSDESSLFDGRPAAIGMPNVASS